ncbi:hypothetical protein DT019_02995 [Streptomyces sp. SDr-06]|uniref:DUF6221 family protein n=1 Tax=Streptomyces sp. SDr-06 TaxID=2267702 RepID=UPI000DE816AE|nr:DUF6221 family protein [Streptomyces sp. SDr-06]RCH70470.1 hypothetical protein DT019_02995 [Streptomyces sp. SDr-06]
MTDDLVQFIRDRLDERVARLRALPAGPWEWRRFDEVTEPEWRDCLVGQDGSPLLSSEDVEGYQSWIRRHEAFDGYLQDIQPECVLADIQAKRSIVAAYEEAVAWYDAPENRHHLAGEVTGLYSAVRLLALPFATHPDYREEWRP